MRAKIDNTEYYIRLGKQLKYIRKNIGLSQKDVALKIGVTFQQYQKYESGINRIPAKSLVTFCEFTNTDIKKLIGCSPTPNSFPQENTQEIHIKKANANNLTIKIIFSD